MASLGRGTTLLVDTYDIARGGRGSGSRSPAPELGAVRIDSGDLGVLAHEVRAQLDALGATGTRIMVTSDLDEFAIAALAAAPVDAYGVGTQLVTGSGHPTCGFVYKLVAREGDDGELVVGGEEEHRQDLHRRPQVRPAPTRPRRRRRGRGDRHRHAARERRRRPRAARRRWCATARSSAASRSTTPAPATSASRAELPQAAQQMSRGEPVIPTIHQ